MHKSIRVLLTVRSALVDLLADQSRPFDERMLLALATIEGRGWMCAPVVRHGFTVVEVSALVPEGGAQLLTLAETPRQRRRILRDLAKYGGFLFVGCDPAAIGCDLAPVRVVGVKIDLVRAAEAARDALAEQWSPDTRVSLTRYAVADEGRAG